MHDLHIGDFFKDAAATLITLYMRFPAQSILYVEDICSPDEPDEYGLHSKRFLSALGAILWMADEGYIRYSQVVKQEAIEQAVLTLKSFTYFASVSDDGKTQRILELEHTLKHGTSIELNDLMLKHLSNSSH